MDNPQATARMPSLHTQKRHNVIKISLIALLMVTLAVGATSVVYIWQGNQIKDLGRVVAHLQNQVQSLGQKNSQLIKTAQKPDTFTYASKVGGLTLTLPTTYGLIVNVDGNKGGAAGATLRVTTLASSNIFSDPIQHEVQIDIDNITTSNLADAVSVAESTLKDEGYNNFNVTDTTIAGLAAKTDTVTDEVPYKAVVYVVRSSDFLYRITTTPSMVADPSSALFVLLKNIQIKPVSM